MDTLSKELAIALPKLPKVIFSSHVVDTMTLIPRLTVQDYEHMLVVHSIEPSLSMNSLIYNFSLEIQRNYFAELHSILRTSIVHTTQSTYIQLIDGLKKNFYVNYHGHIAQLLNKESDEFKRTYEKACDEGNVSFKFYRLMIVGPEGVGKTSLLRVLTGQTFQEDEKTTEFLNKYDLQVQKLSLDWSEMQDLKTYIQDIEDTFQDLAMKLVAQKLSVPRGTADIPDNTQIKKEINMETTKAQLFSHSPTPSPHSSFHSETESIDDELSPSEQSDHGETFDTTPFEQISATLNRFQSLNSKTDFFTAWDFAGQNYLYCFHSLFLSPRSVYLLLVDLTIENLNKEIQERRREDRHEKRSQSGVPKTYLEVYTFWLNAIYSVSKTGLTNGYYSTAKIIFVFSKADKVTNAESIAQEHLKTIRVHMYKKNNSFSLVHESDGIFLLSCKAESPYFDYLPKLKATIKRISDQVAFEEPIPIKWLKLANDILRDNKPILDMKRINYLTDSSISSKDLHHFLHFFNDIGFFFYKQDKIIIAIQQLLNLIYYILFPQFDKKGKCSERQLKEFQRCKKESKLSFNLFEFILDRLHLSDLRIPLLDLMLLYGILIPCEDEGDTPKSYYVPYLLNGSLDDLKHQIPHQYNLNSRFFVFFPDGFLPASLYFTLLSKCLLRKKDKNLLSSHLGFDCAIFHLSNSLYVSFNFATDYSHIVISFYKIVGLPLEEGKINCQIVDYLKFVQLYLVEIQTSFIPCGQLAKVMFVCEYCDTLSQLIMGEKPTCSLDNVYSTNTPEIISQLNELDKLTNSPSNTTIGKGFCCWKQLNKVSDYINSLDLTSELRQQPYDNTMLAEFIINNRNIFMEQINWKDLACLLYTYGLITIQRYSTIINRDSCLEKLSYDFLMDMVHKGSHWAIRLYVTLCKVSEHETLLRLIRDHFKSTPADEPSIQSNRSERTIIPSVYRMNRNRHGIALVVNIESFENGGNYSKRVGSKLDVASLVRLFDFIQYDTKVFENLTRLEYIRAQREIQSLDQSAFDSFFCVIMSHGNEKGEVIFYNNKPLSKGKIVNEFSPRYCQGLRLKPKMFIFQACRGSRQKQTELNCVNEAVQPELLVNNFESVFSKYCSDNSIDNPLPDNIPMHRLNSTPIAADIDTFIGDSTVDQHVSYRSESIGTFFIQSFCSVMQSCSNMEFTHIMMEVRRKVSLYSNKYLQCTEDTNRLLGPVYF